MPNENVPAPSAHLNARQKADAIHLAAVAKTSHGISRNITAGGGTQLRSSPNVADVSFALDASVFRFLRDSRVNLPTILAWVTTGIEGVPAFSTLVPTTSPTLSATIYAQALRMKYSDRTLKLEGLIAQLAQQYGVDTAVAQTLVNAASEYLDKIHEKGNEQLIAKLLIEGSNGDGFGELTGALAEPLTLSWSTYSQVFNQLAVVYSELLAGHDLEFIEQLLAPLLENPEYMRFVTIIRNLKTLALPMRSMSLYSVYDNQRLFSTDDDLGQQYLPTVSSIRIDPPANTKASKTYFGNTNPNDYNLGYDIQQMKYWKVSNPFAGTFDIADLIATVLHHDTSVFALPLLEFDIAMGLGYIVKNGPIGGLPKFAYPGESLFNNKQVSALIGLIALQQGSTSTGSQLLSQVTSLITAYKKTNTNVALYPSITNHLTAMVSLVQAFGIFRNICWNAVEQHNAFSMRKKQQSVQPTERVALYSYNAVSGWVDFYASVIDQLSQQLTDDSTPGSLYHPTRISSLPMPFSISPDLVQSTLMEKPWYYFSSAADLVVRPPVHQATGGGVVYGTASALPAVFTYAGNGVMSARTRLASGLGVHHVIHIMQEEFPAGSVDFTSFVRHFPTPIMRAYANLGRLEATNSSPDAPLPTALVVAELVTRSIVGYKDTSDLASMRYAILGLTPSGAAVGSETGQLSATVRRMFAAAEFSATINYDGKKLSIASMEEGVNFLDLGDSNFFFIFERQDQLFAEDAVSIQEPFSLPYPLFAVHTSALLPSTDIPALVQPVMKLDLPGVTAEARITLRSTPETPMPAGTDKNDSVAESGRISVNDTIVDSESSVAE